ncbi:MAG: PspC domain-containing protein [Bacteroidia bacterium]|nr:PspC domain-containing protein [Bacteroidia bacterium]
MKKTLSINLNGIAFNIDEDAYQTLKQYTSEISAHYNTDDDKEVIKDIEARIAELFSEKLRDESKNVVEINHVISVIDVLGRPNQFESEGTTTETSNNTSTKKRSKHFYRNPENSILGGVAAGLAVYLGWDVTLIRILIILTVIFGFGWSILFYIVVWIIAPEARTAAQKLEMRGEDVTIENIKSQFNNAKDYVESDNFKSSAKSVGKTMGEIFITICKVILIIMGCFAGFIGLVIIGALLTAAVCVFANPALFLGLLPFTLLPGYIAAIIGICALFIVLCPLIGLVTICIRIIRHKNGSESKWFGWTLLIIWLLSIITLAGVSLGNINRLHEFGSEWENWKNQANITSIQWQSSFPNASSIDVNDSIDNTDNAAFDSTAVF